MCRPDVRDIEHEALGVGPGEAKEVFTRDDSGAVVGIDLAGRLFSRVPATS
ncbi:hypothetical protein [Nonomuraea basaltis]|uniref:hypothetical protein n=1 Tax=Nonomuraea basaltis TaxID=2495887 RepID=UPI0014867DB9|nr:hypothetical protein [Nonomuraea basaltis]